MPTLDGYETCLRIREFYRERGVPQPYIVAVTGNVETSQIQRAWNSQFDEVLGKPATVAILKLILEQVLDTESLQ